MFDPDAALFPSEDEEGIFLDRNSYVKMWVDCLPHWEQAGKTQFVTFRLADSLPASKLALLHDIKARFIECHPGMDKETLQLECQKLLSPRYHEYLDAGYGSCILRKPEIRKVVSDSIDYYDGIKYDLLGYVVMPNHVHLVATMLGDSEANTTIDSVKRYCTVRLNKTFNTGNRLFSRNWDRMIRNEGHLQYVLAYILRNPRFLSPREYTLGGRIIKKYLKQK